MTEKNIDMMKKLIEEKKKKGNKQQNNLIPGKTIGEARKGKRNNKQGGQFDSIIKNS